MSKYGLSLARIARLGRRQLIAFAILSAIINGLVTAGVGASLAQLYAGYQRKNTALQSIADLVYERRTRAGMVAYALRRNAELDEVRYRKRAYDEAFVAWNTKVQRNIFMIRDITGETGVTRLETQFQDLLVPALAATDRCITASYDARLKGADPVPVLDACRMTDLHQFTLDCAASLTNELDRLTRNAYLPFSAPSDTTRKAAEARVDKGCLNMPVPKPDAAPVSEPAKSPDPASAAATPAADASPAAPK